MGQVNYKTDYAAFTASQRRAEEDTYAGDEAYTGKCLRPRARITRALVGALLISVLSHGIFTMAVALSPAAPATIVAQQTTYLSSARVVHLDWDQYYAQDSKTSAADIQANDGAANNAPQPPEVAAAVAQRERSEERKQAEPPEVTPERDKRHNLIERDAAPTAAVNAIVHTGDDTKIQLPDSSDASAHVQLGERGEHNPNANAIGGASTGSAGIARGPHQRADSSGDGTSVDLVEVRRGHLSQLNRAIRKKNPCTRKLTHRGLSGDVVLGLTQDSSGRVDKVRVLRSSGEPLIDDAAKQFVRDQQGLPAPGESLTGDVWKIGLRFKCGS